MASYGCAELCKLQQFLLSAKLFWVATPKRVLCLRPCCLRSDRGLQQRVDNRVVFRTQTKLWSIMFFEWNSCFFSVSSFASPCLNWGGRLLDKLREHMYRYNIGVMLACFGVWSFASAFLNRRDKGKGNMYRHSILVILPLFLLCFLAANALSKYGKKATLSGLNFFSRAFLNWGKK